MKRWVPLLFVTACIQEVKAPGAEVAATPATVMAGQLVTLDGSASADPASLPLDYRWRVVSAPAGSAALVRGDGGASASLVPDAQGDFVIGLVVKNALKDSAEQTVTINVAGACGTVPAQQPIKQGERFALPQVKNEMGCAGVVQRQWEVANKPAKSIASVNTDDDSFVPDIEGDYALSYQIRIDAGPWMPAQTLALTAQACPINVIPLLNARPDKGLVQMGRFTYFDLLASSMCGREIVSQAARVLSTDLTDLVVAEDLLSGVQYVASSLVGTVTFGFSAKDSAGQTAQQTLIVKLAPFSSGFLQLVQLGLALKVRADDTPVVAYQDAAAKVQRVRFLDAGVTRWVDEPVLTGLAGEVDHTVQTGLASSLALAPDGSPRIAFLSTVGATGPINGVYYGERGATGWNTIPLLGGAFTFPTVAPYSLQLLTGVNGGRTLVFGDSANSIRITRCAAACTATPSNWSPPGLVVLAGPIATLQAVSNSSGEVILAYQTAALHELNIVKCSATLCTGPLSTFTTGNAAVPITNVSLAISATNELWVGYTRGELTDYNMSSGDSFVRLAQCTGTANPLCATGVQSVLPVPASSLFIGLDASERVHMLLRDTNYNGYLAHAIRQTDGSFRIESTTQSSANSCYNSDFTPAYRYTMLGGFGPAGAHVICGPPPGGQATLDYMSPDYAPIISPGYY